MAGLAERLGADLWHLNTRFRVPYPAPKHGSKWYTNPMPYSDPKKQRKAQHEWYLTVVKARKSDWFLANGPCKKCGSIDDLELDHIDPTKKVSHNVWTWADERRARELAKCQALCHNCHVEKTYDYCKEMDTWKVFRKIGPKGTAWCTGHQDFHPVAEFGSRADNWNGLREYCRKFRNEAGKKGLQM